MVKLKLFAGLALCLLLAVAVTGCTSEDVRDQDGDGFTNSEELQAGTDPFDSDSFPPTEGGGGDDGGGTTVEGESSVFGGVVDYNSDSDTWTEATIPVEGGVLFFDASSGNAQGSIGLTQWTTFSLRWYNAKLADKMTFTRTTTQSNVWRQKVGGLESLTITSEYLRLHNESYGYTNPIEIQFQIGFDLMNTKDYPAESAYHTIKWSTSGSYRYEDAYTYTLIPTNAPKVIPPTMGNITMVVQDPDGATISGAVVSLVEQTSTVPRAEYQRLTDENGEIELYQVRTDISYEVHVEAYGETGLVFKKDTIRTIDTVISTPAGDSSWVFKFSSLGTGTGGTVESRAATPTLGYSPWYIIGIAVFAVIVIVVIFAYASMKTKKPEES